MKVLTEAMVNVVTKFRNWLSQGRKFLFSWYTHDATKTQEPEWALIELPTAIRSTLVSRVENLPSNSAAQTAIADA